MEAWGKMTALRNKMLLLGLESDFSETASGSMKSRFLRKLRNYITSGSVYVCSLRWHFCLCDSGNKENQTFWMPNCRDQLFRFLLFVGFFWGQVNIHEVIKRIIKSLNRFGSGLQVNWKQWHQKSELHLSAELPKQKQKAEKSSCGFYETLWKKKSKLTEMISSRRVEIKSHVLVIIHI